MGAILVPTLRGAHNKLRVVAVALALCFGSATASAQSLDRLHTLFDEFRLGMMAHDIEPNGNEGSVDMNVELLFRGPAVRYNNRLADIFWRPRFHIGASINAGGDTNQLYAGLTWNVPLAPRWTFEFTFGGAVHDGPTDGATEYSFGCSLNFRESASLGYAVSDRWRVYGTVTHMSNGNLCDQNSGLTSAGVRMGYTLN